jgi:hypothetical protein
LPERAHSPSCISFLTDVSLSFSHRLQGDRFEPENPEERQQLKDFGTDTPYFESSARVSTRTFGGSVTQERITDLLPRRVGLRIYAEALKNDYDVAKFENSGAF